MPQKWIRRIWKKIGKSPSQVEQELQLHPKGWVYILFNSVTKRLYIGETSRTLCDRLQEHIRATKGNEKRKCYNYMRRIMPGNWTILPLEHAETKEELERLEEKWKYHFRNNMINDPVIWMLKPTRRSKTKHTNPEVLTKRKISQQERIRRRRLQTAMLRRRVNFILHDKHERWRAWSISSLLDLLIHINVAKVPKQTAKQVFHRIKPVIFGKTGVNIRREYVITVMHCPSKSFKKDMKSIIAKIIDSSLSHLHPLLRQYLSSHIKVVGKTYKSIGEMINNSRKVLKKHDYICVCETSNLPKVNGHVCVKSIDLPPEHKSLQNLLLRNKKTPIHFNLKAYYGIQFNMLRTSLKNIGINSWNQQLNEILFYKLKNSYQRIVDPTFIYQNIKNVIQPYSKFCFVELDKNANTFAVICKKLYIEKNFEHFADKHHYEVIEKEEETLKKEIEEELKHLKLTTIGYVRKHWKIGPARLLPKNKDITKWRPLVSYYHFVGKNIGRKIARGIMTISKYLTGHWTTFELSNCAQFTEKVNSVNELYKKHDGLGFWTFCRFDIKNQFTHLPKKDVKTALKFALDAVEDISGKNSVAICTRDWHGKKDIIGTGKKRDYLTIKFEDLLKYATFEMDYPYFQVGSTIYKQKEGLPMGGNLSAVLAIIYSMWCEHTNRLLWTNPLSDKLLYRYRDDILCMEFVEEYPCKIYYEHIQKTLSSLYSTSLTVELEEKHILNMNFLDYYIIGERKLILIGSRNNNIDLCNNKVTPHTIVIFPEMVSSFPKQLIIEIITGVNIKIKRN